MLDIQSLIGVPKIVHESLDEYTTRFRVQYLPRGFGHTLGNALRRVVLGYGSGGAITGLKVVGAAHEYHVLTGIKQPMVDVMLNFKKLRFKLDESIERVQWLSISFSGVGACTAKDLVLPAGVELLNPEVLLLEISDPSIEFQAEMRLEKGYGYYSLDYLRTREEKEDAQHVGLLLIDNDFKAVDYVKYHVDSVIDDFSGSSKDELIIDVKTMSPDISAQELLSFAGEVVSSYAKLFIFDDIYVDKSLLVDYYDIAESSEKMVESMNIKTIPIDALPLSERTRNALIKNDILYVEDLEKKRKSELLSMKGIGKKAVDEIIESLDGMGKSLEG